MFAFFVLILYVFLQSAPAYNWFTVDPKLVAFVGMVFVIAAVVEVFLWFRGIHPLRHRVSSPT